MTSDHSADQFDSERGNASLEHRGHHHRGPPLRPGRSTIQHHSRWLKSVGSSRTRSAWWSAMK